jgi:Chalcone isomerase-like
MHHISSSAISTRTQFFKAYMPMLSATLLCGFMLLSLSPKAMAGTIIEGHDYADTAAVAGHSLKLNGVGIRAVAWLKGYVAGLYVLRPSNSPAVLLKAGGAKRVSLTMLREADTEVFVKAVRGGIEKNLTAEEIAGLETRLQSFDATVRAIGKVKPGDVVDLDFVPEKGLVLGFNGATRGAPVAGKDFYEAILGIFIGDNPVDKSLKQGLLGLKKTPQPKPTEPMN